MSGFLFVDDDQGVTLLMRRAFQKAGVTAEIRTLPDGESALAYLAGQAPYDDRGRFPLPRALLLDLRLPRASGFDVLSWVRAQPLLRRLPIVVFSSSNLLDDVNRAYDLGANSFLVKPSEYSALVDLARSLHEYWERLNAQPQIA